MTIVSRYILTLSLFVLTPIAAQVDKAESIAAAVPPEVSEIVAGGTWSDNGASGFYRAMVITPGASGPAEIVVQLLSQESEDAPPKVAKTVTVKEVVEQGFSSAVLAMDAEIENEMTLIVTAYGSDSNQDTAIEFKFDGTGAYKVVPIAAEGADGALGNSSNN